jgi:phosphoglycerate dehydrogenase-like enzyme
VAEAASTGVLLSERFVERYGERVRGIARETGLRLEPIPLPRDPAARLADEPRDRVELAYFSTDLFPDGARAFFAAVHGAPRLRWVHVFNAGTDHPVFQRLLERGVRLSSSAGASAEPIAQTAIAALLWLARGFPHWQEAQRRRAWERLPDADTPRDLAGQTIVIVGLGGIGREIARLARALHLHVIGVRRSPRTVDDPVDELHPPSALPDLLPRAEWLALACPLTHETHRLIDARALALLPRGARVLSVGRGEVVDEAALVHALAKGHLAGAYLDVFEVEPLPAASPLWGLSNVIVTPHNSAASRGNERRQAESFLANLARFARGEPLANEVKLERAGGTEPAR